MKKITKKSVCAVIAKISSQLLVLGLICPIAIACSLLMQPSATVAEPLTPSFSPYVKASGEIVRPTDYRDSWSHLGSWSVPKDDGLQIHEVYTERDAVAAYRKDGQFPDGTVLVKEVRATKAKDMTTGHPSWETDPMIWFVMVKDAQNRFAENPHWGEGWGWALFKADNPFQDVSTSFEADCLSCHIPAKETDYVYSFAYPTLSK